MSNHAPYSNAVIMEGLRRMSLLLHIRDCASCIHWNIKLKQCSCREPADITGHGAACRDWSLKAVIE